MTMAELRECKFLTDRSGRRWINEEQISRAGYEDFHQIDLINVAGTEFYDVVGYSEKRKAFWVEPIELEVKDEEVVAFVEGLGTGQSE
jgi:hypothetical protein